MKKEKKTLAYSKKGDESLQRKLQCVLINVKMCRTKEKSFVQVLSTEVFVGCRRGSKRKKS